MPQGKKCTTEPIIRKLRDYLKTVPAGPVEDRGPLQALLAECWNQFAGAAEEEMKAEKLNGRMENICWESPILTFTIARHGGTVQGSSRETLQQWQVDVSACTAECRNHGHRQVRKMNPRLDVQPLVEEITRLILAGAEDDCLKWTEDGSVRVMVSTLIPEASISKQTLQARRKRFRLALEQKMKAAGWRRTGVHSYAP